MAPGFEPGMEILQIQRGRELCCLVLDFGLSGSTVLPRVRALLDYVRTAVPVIAPAAILPLSPSARRLPAEHPSPAK